MCYTCRSLYVLLTAASRLFDATCIVSLRKINSTIWDCHTKRARAYPGILVLLLDACYSELMLQFALLVLLVPLPCTAEQPEHYRDEHYRQSVAMARRMMRRLHDAAALAHLVLLQAHRSPPSSRRTTHRRLCSADSPKAHPSRHPSASCGVRLCSTATPPPRPPAAVGGGAAGTTAPHAQSCFWRRLIHSHCNLLTPRWHSVTRH